MKNKSFQIISTCRACGNKRLKKFIDLGNQPLANSLLDSPDQTEDKYPLSLSWCANCHLVQLNETIDPKVLFSKYVWVTGTSQQACDFAPLFRDNLIKRLTPSHNKFVVEIASNDGTFLEPFVLKGYKVLGIDPAVNLAEIARRKKITTLPVFFGSSVAQEIADKYGRVPAIFARNVVAHVASLRDFIVGVKRLLADDGVVAIEPHYAGHILKGLQYDSIYHEHLCYFTLETLSSLLRQEGLYVFDVENSPISGGAIIVYASPRKRPKSNALKKFIVSERRSKINSESSWRCFARSVFKHRKVFRSMLESIKTKQGKLIGYGASARSSTLLNFCGIDTRLIPVIADANPLKHNKFTAGTHIPIKLPDRVWHKDISHVCILGWNFRDEIVRILKTKYRFRGSYIIPLPKNPKVVRIM